MYSYSGLATGGSFALGYGRGTSIGFKAAWYFNPGRMDILELCFLLRFYLTGFSANSGPFLQLTGGPVIFFPEDKGVSMPAELGMVSGGLNFGWRLLVGNRWFVEPSIRGGYPFLVGAAFSAGVRF